MRINTTAQAPIPASSGMEIRPSLAYIIMKYNKNIIVIPTTVGV